MVRLSDLVDIRTGYPFRGSVPAAHDGNVRVIQMRDISIDGSVAWGELTRAEIPDGKASDCLKDGEVLFAARGNRNYAIHLSNTPTSIVCSQYFYVLRCKTTHVLPAYLAWYINRAPSQRYLATNAEGTDQLSIRRSVLENLPILLPGLNDQASIAGFAEAAMRERRNLEALIKNREQQLEALALQLLASANQII